MSELLDEELLVEFNELSNPSTNCMDWDAAFSSTTRDGEAAFFRSLRTVAKADCAVARSSELSALPSAVRSVES